MSNIKPLSFSAIKTYSECGRRYQLRYKEKLKPKHTHAALSFGSAIDGALNKLLTTRSLKFSVVEFEKQWNFQWINKKYVPLSDNPDIVYAETDFDADLLLEEDWEKLEQYLPKTQLDFTLHASELYKMILDEKKSSGWVNLREDKKKFYNYMNWLSLLRKGHIILKSYNEKVMPSITSVLAVQKETYLENSDGDRVVQYLDLIVKWKDGRNILFDNKTSAREYEQDSAGKSPQLISYYVGSKADYDLEAVGFIVMRKGIFKNKVKVCSVCNYDGSGARYKTCSNLINEERCNGEWKETIFPECNIQVIINNVHPNAEELVISAFDDANKGIKMEYYPKNLSACKNGPIVCEFFDLCHFKDDKNLVKVE